MAEQPEARVGPRPIPQTTLLYRLAGTERRRLASLLALAALVRLVFLLTPGYDVRDYQVWAGIVLDTGIGRAYSADYPPPIAWYNYPPFYLYVLRATARLYALVRPGGPWQDQLLAALLKLSPIAAELALGLLLYWFIRRRATSRLALLAAAAYLLNPAIVWDTAYWGAIDAFHALFLTAALVATAERRPAVAWPLATLAIGSKLIALPGALAVAIPPLRAASRPRLGLAAAASLLTGLLLALPVLLARQFGAMARAMFRNLGNSAVASANAHNLWWLVSWGDGWRADTARLLPGLSYRVAGLLLFALCAAWALALLWRKPGDAALLCGAGAFLTFAFFFLTTEVHENWPFALFAPLAAAAALRPAYRPLYAALSATFLLNLALHDPPLRDRLGAGFDGPAHTLGLLNAAANLVIFAWWLWLLARAGRSPAQEAAPSLASAVPDSETVTADVDARGSLLRWP